MSVALVLVDLQNDFLDRPDAAPPRSEIVASAAELTDAFRASRRPVVHVRTVFPPGGGMPHWEAGSACIEGTPGAEPPAALAPEPGEPVVRKAWFSAFSGTGLEAVLRERGVETIVLAGVFLESCIRATALDAYALGFGVRVVDDAFGWLAPAHAALTREHLASRAAAFVPLEDACAGRFGGPPGESPARAAVRAAAASAAVGSADWAARPAAERRARLARWADALEARADEIVETVVAEIGKPVSDARGELRRAVAHLRVALDMPQRARTVAPGVTVRRRPLGVVAVVTPWNNPVAIPAGKIGPALVLGNTVVWKPSPAAPRTSALLAGTIEEAGLAERVAVASGGADVVRALTAESAVDAITLTGSTRTGREVAALCASRGKPLQAELGGNNAAIVLADFDFRANAREMALSAFRFAGQRCTAIRRFVVEASIAEAFTEALVAATRALRVGPAADPRTDVGPLISQRARRRVLRVVADAVADGATLLCGGDVPDDLPRAGAWLRPAVLAGVQPETDVVRRETFGPVAVVQEARDLEHAIELADGTEYGLVGALLTNDDAARARFAEAVRAGILHTAPGALPVHAEAPFGGWKASGIGPPEHGVFDLEFFTRAQAVYGPGAGETQA